MMTKKEVSAGGIVYKKVMSYKLQVMREWLICQHSQHKGWGFPKGLIGDTIQNEKIEQTALREVEEEGGIKAKIVNNKPVIVNYQYQWNNSPHGGSGGEKILVNKTVYYFLMEYVSGDPKNHDWEVSEAKFVTEEKVKKILTFKSDKEAFEKMLQLIS